MKTKIYKYITIILASTTVLFGCTKDFLDQNQLGAIPVDQFYKTDADATNAIAACYNYMQTINSSWVSSLWMMKESLSDDIYSGGQNAGDQAAYTQLGAYNFESDNGIILNNYQYIRNIIGRTNTLIDKLPGTTPYQKLVLGEAKTIRAYNYIELVSMWGPVPLVLHDLTLENANQPNAKISDIYAKIDSDLVYAISVLPLKSKLAASGSDISRISKGTAQALLGKARLYNKDYAGAIAALTPILPSGVDVDNFALYQLSDAEIHGDLSQILRKSTHWGKESLWEIDWSTARAQTWANSYGDIFNNPSRTNTSFMIVQLCGPRGDEGFTGGSKNINGGWGFGYPSTVSYDAYTTEGDTVRRNAGAATRAQIEAAGGKMGSLSVTGDTMFGMWNCPGLIRLKYTTWADETNAVGQPELNYGTHLRLIRYADVLLMAAEAYVQLGQPASALPLINAVRTRANVPALLSVTMTDIKLERQVELNYEGFRYQDLIRWGDAITVLANQGTAIPTGQVIKYKTKPEYITQKFGNGFRARNVLLPFPLVEKNANTNPGFKQNAGF